MEQKRLIWVDYAKSIGIFLVVLGHATSNYSLRSFIYVFHIPLFFFISGMFFSFDKYPSYKSFFKRRFSQLVIPYLIFNFITYLLWLFIGRKVGNDRLFDIDVFHPLIGIFYGHLNNHFMEHCAPLWFIACLFSVENIYYIVFKRIKSLFVNVLVLVVFVALGYVDYKFIHLFFPWGINIAFSVMIFYGLGVLYRKYLLAKERHVLILLFLISLGITYLISNLNGKIEVSMKEFGNYLYYIIGALVGIVMIFSFSKIEEAKLGKIKLQLLIGEKYTYYFSITPDCGLIVERDYVLCV